MFLSLFVLMGVGFLAACSTNPSKNPAWELAGHPGLLYQIKSYYEDNALEEGGRCGALILEGVTSTRVVDDGSDKLVIDIGYYYRDYVRGGDDCSPFRPLRCGVMSECRGFGQRTFTVTKQDDALKVVGMSGEQKKPRAPAP